MKKLTLVGMFCCAAVSASADPTLPPNMNLAEDRARVLEMARKMIQADPYMTLVTVDEHGQPHARIMEHSPPDENMVIYFSTIPGTRKLEQIRQNPKVTLFFNGPGDFSYLSVIGLATIHTDISTIKEHAWREPAARAQFWPDYPDNFVLVRLQPRWLELVAPQLESRETDWRPQAVVFE